MQSRDRLGIALVGAGFMGDVHTTALARDTRAELRWIVDPTAKKARRLSATYRRERAASPAPRIRVAAELSEALQDEGVQAVFLCTRPRSHAALAQEALEAGRSVLLEKPITYTLAEARRLEQVAKSSGQLLFVAHVCRFFPEYVRIREAVKAGDIGTPAMVRASRVMGNPGSWYSDPQQSLGVPGDLLLHDFDLALWMFGTARRVYGMSRARQPPIGEQHFLASLRHRGGTISHLEGSWAHPGGFRTRFEVSGSEGVLEYDSARRSPLLLQRSRVHRRGAQLVVPESPSHASPYDLQAREFLDCVLDGRKPRIRVSEAVHALEVALAAERSSRSGKLVECANPLEQTKRSPRTGRTAS